jgi:hypothetical protein
VLVVVGMAAPRSVPEETPVAAAVLFADWLALLDASPGNCAARCGSVDEGALNLVAAPVPLADPVDPAVVDPIVAPVAPPMLDPSEGSTEVGTAKGSDVIELDVIGLEVMGLEVTPVPLIVV